MSEDLKVRAESAAKRIACWEDGALDTVDSLVRALYISRGESERRPAWEALSAVAEWQVGAPSLADLRAEAEAAVECAATAIRSCGYLVIADETVRNWRDDRTMWLLRGLVDCVADMATGAEVFVAIEAVARWRRAEMEDVAGASGAEKGGNE